MKLLQIILKSKVSFFIGIILATQILRLASGILIYFWFDGIPENVTKTLSSDLHPIFRFLKYVVLTTIVEELYYRIGLKFTPFNFSIAIVFIAYEILTTLVDVGYYDAYNNFISRLLIS